MSVFDSPSFRDHEQVGFWQDSSCGLRAIIAIHDTRRGPALGGLRMWPYGDEAEAIEDVLRLSRGMTFKAAMADLPFGGGKAVILGDPRQDKSPALFASFGRFVDSLGGRYITAEDVGIAPGDIEQVRRTTRHVAGIAEGGSDDGDPSPATAWGVFHGLKAAVRHRLGRPDLQDLTVAVQGLGHVGWLLCRHLHDSGARLVVSDIDRNRLTEARAVFGAEAVDVDAIYDADVDVYAPCALGATLNDDSLPRLRASIVAGSANNQLAEDRHGEALRARGILYAPDYVINAGGIINISHEGPDYDRERAFAHCARIGETLAELFRRADRDGLATAGMADRMAQEILDSDERRQAA